jgi:branched-chain amino acid transport system substrate-binding protein
VCHFDLILILNKMRTPAHRSQAASIHDLKLPMLLPGITVSTSAGDFAPIKQMQLEKFDGATWKLFGEVISGSGS